MTPASTISRSGQGESVWVLSSDAQQARSLTELLEDAGYGALALESAAAALAQAAVAPPDLLLLDAQLSDGSGFDLARRLKALARTSPAPIIFLADPSHPEHLVQALDILAASYLTFCLVLNHQ